MNNAHEHGGWTISEVERLTGLPRRDIQRCCYSGKGGLGIVKPQDSTWGRRTYSVEEVALLYVVQLERLEGLSLPEISERFHESAGDGSFDVAKTLAIRAARLDEQRETICGRLAAAHALHLALDGGGSCDAIGSFVEQSIGNQVAFALRALEGDRCRDGEQTKVIAADAARNLSCTLRAGWLTRTLSPAATLGKGNADETKTQVVRALAGVIDVIHETAGVSHDFARRALSWAFDAPGMALAVELWLGAGAFELVAEALRY